ncbi:hypothetical protein GCM10009677_51600 [Sphaerisporangium rubeum]|uniref:Uncharacterized protein n=1 Tax=Sphaerisporangium rubeum TaxID=321317 RepID=A0A7X0IGZ6_9ACTN|nr:hypothetical protein [Sphaerisporangium rubeum]MBB6475050.1 hypothetical protein [Sphaerisporangium rubeum]
MTGHGYRARWRGAEYAAVPDPRPDGVWIRLRGGAPAEGFTEVTAGVHVRPVPAGECDEVVYAVTACEWRGAPCQVRDARDGELLVEYVGGLVPVARGLGLARVERGVYRGWVPRVEVRNLREDVVRLEF